MIEQETEPETSFVNNHQDNWLMFNKKCAEEQIEKVKIHNHGRTGLYILRY